MQDAGARQVSNRTAATCIDAAHLYPSHAPTCAGPNISCADKESLPATDGLTSFSCTTQVSPVTTEVVLTPTGECDPVTPTRARSSPRALGISAESRCGRAPLLPHAIGYRYFVIHDQMVLDVPYRVPACPILAHLCPSQHCRFLITILRCRVNNM